LEKKQAADEAVKNQAAVKDNAETIFNSPRQVVIAIRRATSPSSSSSITTAVYCKTRHGRHVRHDEGRSKLKVVLKEFRCLARAVEAARVAVAVRMQDKTGKKYIEFTRSCLTAAARPTRRARCRRQGDRVGHGAAGKDLTKRRGQGHARGELEAREKLGLNGTPSYVIGSNVVIGAVASTSSRKASAPRAARPLLRLRRGRTAANHDIGADDVARVPFSQIFRRASSSLERDLTSSLVRSFSSRAMSTRSLGTASARALSAWRGGQQLLVEFDVLLPVLSACGRRTGRGRLDEPGPSTGNSLSTT